MMPRSAEDMRVSIASSKLYEWLLKIISVIGGKVGEDKSLVASRVQQSEQTGVICAPESPHAHFRPANTIFHNIRDSGRR
ncbi:hypothetical protein BDR07DRAFT_1404891 [Suillus spraguei]|nr:hypothetical protein BDR07DRAFT_1404891 [Suillus spraguei]